MWSRDPFWTLTLDQFSFPSLASMIKSGHWANGNGKRNVSWKLLEESLGIYFQTVMEVILRSASVVQLDTFLTSQTYRLDWTLSVAKLKNVCVPGSLLRAQCHSTGSWMRTVRWESLILVRPVHRSCHGGGRDLDIMICERSLKLKIKM